MKKYRLKQWYPSLQKKTIEGNIANWDDDEKAYTVIQNADRVEILDKTEVENNPDFWELIEEEKPLFTTEDGVEVYDIDFLVFAVKGNFLKIQTFALAFSQNKKDMKSFYHESNADKYIWRNKRVFSYEDIRTSIFMGNEKLKYIKLAKERSKE